MSTLNKAYSSISELNLWFKIQAGDELALSDVPSILPLRWNYFKTTWEYIKPNLLNATAAYSDPDFMNSQIDSFSKFIESQRNSKSKVNPFSDAVTLNKYYAVFDNIPINSIPLTNEEQRIVEQTVNRVGALSKNDFIKIKINLRDYRDRYADTINLSDPDYNRALGKSSIPPQINATITDINYMMKLQDGINSADFVLANLFANDQAIDPFLLAKQNANNPEINIGQYSSGRLVKMHYGESLQALATRFLGSPDKWLDIAIANGLKPPYIDEVGERIPLLSNASGNQINLSGTDITGNLNIDKLYINQVVIIKSDIQVIPDQRKIINIRQIPVSGEILIELDGKADLAKYEIADNANIRVYKPNTINSGFYVLIPSTDPLPNPRKEETPWFLATAADDEKQAKVDLAVNDSGDLMFSSNGDLSFSYGLENAIQAIKFKLSTSKGELFNHPEYGLISIFGAKTSDFESVKQDVIDSLNSQIAADSRYERIENLSVQYNNASGNAVVVNMAVRLAGGGDKIIPISFTVAI